VENPESSHWTAVKYEDADKIEVAGDSNGFGKLDEALGGISKFMFNTWDSPRMEGTHNAPLPTFTNEVKVLEDGTRKLVSGIKFRESLNTGGGGVGQKVNEIRG